MDISMIFWNTVVSPGHLLWIFCSFALSHRFPTNQLHAELFWINKLKYLYLTSFVDFSTVSTTFLLVPWRRQEPRHQQEWCWHSLSGVFWDLAWKGLTCHNGSIQWPVPTICVYIHVHVLYRCVIKWCNLCVLWLAMVDCYTVRIWLKGCTTRLWNSLPPLLLSIRNRLFATCMNMVNISR